jgi:citrate lyase subunit beta/citryl-CoA lyase
MFNDSDKAFEEASVHENKQNVFSEEIIIWFFVSFDGPILGTDQMHKTITMTKPLIRSKLFVPGARPELFGKALASEADAISIDLEDAVQESRKADAREAVTQFLRSSSFSSQGKTIIVRVNGLDTPHFEADVNACAWPGLDILNLPKAESPEDVHAAAAALERYERERGIGQWIGILANIESPRGLRRASEIAVAHPRVIGLQLGFADLLEPLGIDRKNPVAIQHIQLGLRLAAGEANIPVYDSAFANIKDTDGYRSEAQTAFRLGYEGKTCIHPSQIALANEVFRPSDEEIAHALRVVAAWREAKGKGVGALMVDGRMIDVPFAKRAEAVAALAERLGIAPAA